MPGSTNTVVALSGFEETFKALEQLPTKIEIKILKQAVTKLAKDITAEVKARAPVKTGVLRDSLSLKGATRRKGNISVTMHGKFYARFLEKGTKVRKTKGRGKVKKPALRGRINAEQNKFIQPVIEGRGSQLIDLITEEIANSIENLK